MQDWSVTWSWSFKETNLDKKYGDRDLEHFLFIHTHDLGNLTHFLKFPAKYPKCPKGGMAPSWSDLRYMRCQIGMLTFPFVFTRHQNCWKLMKIRIFQNVESHITIYFFILHQIIISCSRFRAQYDQYFPSFSFFVYLLNKSKIWETRKILAILCEINVR